MRQEGESTIHRKLRICTKALERGRNIQFDLDFPPRVVYTPETESLLRNLRRLTSDGKASIIPTFQDDGWGESIHVSTRR